MRVKKNVSASKMRGGGMVPQKLKGGGKVMKGKKKKVKKGKKKSVKKKK